jgi:uncharacterized protein involved in outer membrane biogenesis
MKAPLTLPLLCATLLATASNLTAQSGWKPLLFDSISNRYQLRSYVSLTFNGSGNPVLAYSDNANGRMKLATRTGSTRAFRDRWE